MCLITLSVNVVSGMEQSVVGFRVQCVIVEGVEAISLSEGLNSGCIRVLLVCTRSSHVWFSVIEQSWVLVIWFRRRSSGVMD